MIGKVTSGKTAPYRDAIEAMLLDTNILIYACQPCGDWLSPWTAHADASIASVTQIEALGYPGPTPQEETALLSVIQQAIKLRQQKKMKLGDAIIAATALEYEIPLITRNEDDFKHIDGLDLRNPFTKNLPGIS